MHHTYITACNVSPYSTPTLNAVRYMFNILVSFQTIKQKAQQEISSL
jgi:hypothetical protein